jgi:large subunit ribosomal protein L6
MKKDIAEILEVPKEIQVKMEGELIILSKGDKTSEKKFRFPKVEIKVKDNKIEFSSKNATKKELKMVYTYLAHLRNMIKGFNEEFVYNLDICNVHFPMTANVDKDKLIIKNYLGEKIPRKANIHPKAKVVVKGNQITVSSYDKEAAGQTAANIEKSTFPKGRDRRIFQDGIFLTSKCGRNI